MANTITREKHERNKRRRYRQMLGAVLCLCLLYTSDAADD